MIGSILSKLKACKEFGQRRGPCEVENRRNNVEDSRNPVGVGVGQRGADSANIVGWQGSSCGCGEARAARSALFALLTLMREAFFGCF